MNTKYAAVLSSADESFDSAVDRLTLSNGVCGKGSFGICFNGVDGEVIKLHPKSDEAYIAFINWVQTLGETTYTKHFPKVYYYQESVGHVDIILERLYKYSDLTPAEQDTLPACLCPETGRTIYEAFHEAKQRFIWALNLHQGRDKYFQAKNWERFKVIPSLEDALQALLLHVWTGGFACDLHDENILFRRNLNGQCEAVIIDPFAF